MGKDGGQEEENVRGGDTGGRREKMVARREKKGN